MYNDIDWVLPGVLMASVEPTGLRYLERVRSMGVNSALNLTEDDWPEDWIKGSGMDYHHIPVEDFGVPTRDQALEAVSWIRAHLGKGAVMVHCRAGLGRTGTIIGVYLVETGMDPSDAIETIRTNRPGSLEVREQERFVLEWVRRGVADG